MPQPASARPDKSRTARLQVATRRAASAVGVSAEVTFGRGDLRVCPLRGFIGALDLYCL